MEQKILLLILEVDIFIIELITIIIYIYIYVYNKYINIIKYIYRNNIYKFIMNINSSSSTESDYGDNTDVFNRFIKKIFNYKKIGEGAFATVWLCVDLESKKYFAIKYKIMK